MFAACQPPQPRQGQSEQADEQANEQAEPTASPAPAPAEPPPKPPEPKSDRAYVNVEGVGVYVIDEQGWQLVWTPMIGRRVFDLAELEFRELPLGGYTLTIEVDGRWVVPRANATIRDPDKTRVLRKVVVTSLE